MSQLALARLLIFKKKRKRKEKKRKIIFKIK